MNYLNQFKELQNEFNIRKGVIYNKSVNHELEILFKQNAARYTEFLIIQMTNAIKKLKRRNNKRSNRNI